MPPDFSHGRSGNRMRIPTRLIIALIIAGISLFTYFRLSSKNPVTGELQRIALTVDEEIALGLHAAPEMAAQFGGLLNDQDAQLLIDDIGQRIIARSAASKSEYRFEFHVLADMKTVNAFALPGGQIFITAALLDRLESPGQIAGVLGHEIGHVVGRHGAEHLAKAQLTQGLTGAAVIAAYDPNNPQATQASAAVAMMIGQLVNMKFGRDDELESDRLGVQYMVDAGYDPRSMIRVMEVLREASQGGAPPEFFSTHPDPDRRIERIQEAIAAVLPQGVPENLEP